MPAVQSDDMPLENGHQEEAENDLWAPVADAKLVKSPTKKKKKKKRGPIINTTNCKYDVVRECADSLGWEEDPDVDGHSGNFNVQWFDTSVLLARVAKLKNFQRINHFPSMHVICRKNHLCNTLGKMKKVFPKYYCFFPKTWTLKAQMNDFRKYLNTSAAVCLLAPPVATVCSAVLLCVPAALCSWDCVWPQPLPAHGPGMPWFCVAPPADRCTIALLFVQEGMRRMVPVKN